ATFDDRRWGNLGRNEEASSDERDSAAEPAQCSTTPPNWDQRIERVLRAKPQEELAELLWPLTRRFPVLYQELRERMERQEVDVDRICEDAHREIRRVTSQPAWRNESTGEGHRPDYSRILQHFEHLLEAGQPDAVLPLGREFIERGLHQVRDSYDDGT